MRQQPLLARLLAQAFLAGDLEEQKMIERASQLLGHRWRWIRKLACLTIDEFGPSSRPRKAAVVRFLCALPHLARAEESLYNANRNRIGRLESDSDLFSNLEVVPLPAQMTPAAGVAESWRVPQLPTVAALAEWLGIRVARLEWLARTSVAPRDRAEHAGRHYHYHWVPKRSGGLRLIEIPKTQLRSIQRELLHQLLDAIPPHEAAHGFCAGRSIRTFASPHVSRAVVVRLDLADFFATITAPRILPIFLTAGYPEAVANCLTGLCTNQLTEFDLLPLRESNASNYEEGKALFVDSHLPQGAPTSPALANLCAFRLDCRLAALAEKAGGIYTRYADDLAFSGDETFARSARRFVIQAMSICQQEGFRVHARKTRIMRASVRQHLAGVVVNNRLNIRRQHYDRLKATLTNCIRRGPESQNRAGHADYRAHLAGAISHVAMLNAERGERLKALFQQINW